MLMIRKSIKSSPLGGRGSVLLCLEENAAASEAGNGSCAETYPFRESKTTLCLWADKDEACTCEGHEHGWNERYPDIPAFLGHPYGDAPKCKYGESLVNPSEIAPKNAEVYVHQEDDNTCKRKGNGKTVEDLVLLVVEEVGSDKTSTAERCITRCHRCSNYSEYSEHGSHLSHPVVADGIHDNGRVIVHLVPESFVATCILDGSGSPDEGYDTFCDHCSVEHRTHMLLVLCTANHQRTLRSMEATYGTASDCYAEHWE